MTERNRFGARAAVTALAVVAIVTAACSGGGDDEASGGDPTATTAAAEAAAARSPGCEAGRALPQADLVETQFEVGGTSRRYLVSAPAQEEGADPLPVVVDFHGLAEGAEVHAEMTQLGPMGVEEGFVTVLPHGTGPPSGGTPSPTPPPTPTWPTWPPCSTGWRRSGASTRPACTPPACPTGR